MSAPYRNEVACVGVTSWKGRDPKGCDHRRPLGLARTHRYSVGPIPREPDVNKSPRCPQCGGLMIEIRGPL